MESEKVKEITDKLREEIFIAKCFGDKLRRVETKALQDILTLINELESELKTRKDRIIELEDGIAKSMLGCEFLPECTNEKLKQFVEMLKKKSAYSFIFGKKFIVENDIDETLKECLKE